MVSVTFNGYLTYQKVYFEPTSGKELREGLLCNTFARKIRTHSAISAGCRPICNTSLIVILQHSYKIKSYLKVSRNDNKQSTHSKIHTQATIHIFRYS
jgi:hypothetical protein